MRGVMLSYPEILHVLDVKSGARQELGKIRLDWRIEARSCLACAFSHAQSTTRGKLRRFPRNLSEFMRVGTIRLAETWSSDGNKEESYLLLNGRLGLRTIQRQRLTQGCGQMTHEPGTCRRDDKIGSMPTDFCRRPNLRFSIYVQDIKF